MPNRIYLALCSGIFALLFCCYALADASFVQRADVQSFIDKMVHKYGFSKSELENIFSQVKIRPHVMQSIRQPLEAQPWYNYQTLFITESRIRGGVEFWNHHADELARAEKQYGVPASIIVATIGVETKYGKSKGEYPVIDALTNISFSDSPRRAYFLSELEEFLLLCREQHLNPLIVKGSYAGAIGQPQFMPSSYRHYAVNFSGNSKIDLSDNIPDIIGSIANYYQKHGWEANQMVVVPALIEKEKYRNYLTQKQKLTITKTDLQHYGIMPYTPVPANQKIKVIELQGYHGNEYWLSMHNFDVIKRYNASNLYAMAVYQLSYYIAALKEKEHRA
jgi:membrane-bound lytic murein transglycosylase B